jgi:act minimal PKS chain-length factor (CLF/KS beta)
MRTAPLITGIGVVAPTGFGAAEHWAATLAGRSAIRTLGRFDPARYPIRLAGEVHGVDPAELIPGRLVPQTDRWTQLALVAAEQAFADAAVDPSTLPEYEAAVLTGSAIGGVEFGQREIERLWSKGPGHVGAYQSIAWFYAATTGQISIRHGLRGSCGVLVSEQASGLDSLGYARWTLQDGARLVVAGGTDAPFSPYGVVCQMASGMLSRSHDPVSAYTPFAAGAQGYVPGEGGAILILEDPEACPATRPPSTPRRTPAARPRCGGRSRARWRTRTSNRPMWMWCSPTAPACPTATPSRRVPSRTSSATATCP